jgi:hypothetical protein
MNRLLRTSTSSYACVLARLVGAVELLRVAEWSELAVDAAVRHWVLGCAGIFAECFAQHKFPEGNGGNLLKARPPATQPTTQPRGCVHQPTVNQPTNRHFHLFRTNNVQFDTEQLTEPRQPEHSRVLPSQATSLHQLHQPPAAAATPACCV